METDSQTILILLFLFGLLVFLVVKLYLAMKTGQICDPPTLFLRIVKVKERPQEFKFEIIMLWTLICLIALVFSLLLLQAIGINLRPE